MGVLQPGEGTEVIAAFFHRSKAPPADLGACTAYHVMNSCFVSAAEAKKLEPHLFDSLSNPVRRRVGGAWGVRAQQLSSSAPQAVPPTGCTPPHRLYPPT